jgi:ubiquinol-cytochrome c reductase cytochrome c1 subunit
MKRILLLGLLWVPMLAVASGGGPELQKSLNDVRNQASLQNGAKIFMNYCIGCHSLQYSRFERVGADLGIPEDLLKSSLMFTAEKPGELMKSPMKPADGAKWFGKTPPDLSVIARSRGTDWLYTYFMTFYADPSRPWGVNNLVFKDVGMPHVLADLQGTQKPVYHEEHGHKVLVGVEPADDAAKAKSENYRRVVTDLVNFLDYVGEPIKVTRWDLGWKVILYLFIFTFFAFLMKRSFWDELH